VKDISLGGAVSVDALMRQLSSSGGFTGRKLAEAADILEDIVRDEGMTTFLSFPACIMATGTRGVIVELVKRKLVDAVITTCGTMDHDLARVWKSYYHGDFLMDDVKLHQEGVNRLGNVLVPNSSYGTVLERKLQPMFRKIMKDRDSISTRELVDQVGSMLDDESSMTYWCHRNNVPVFIPGITDGAFGSQLWMYWQDHRRTRIDLFQDEQELMDLVYSADRAGALMIGGGISKHHTIWWSQFRGGLDKAVYLTTAQEYDGSLSGAQVREAVSWGKVKENADHVTVEGDATITLPFIVSSVLERLG